MRLSPLLRAVAAFAAVPLVTGSALLLSLDAQGEDEKKQVTVRWFGQACFELDFPGGLVVLVDPFDPKIGYAFPSGVKPDVVTISHEHFDHSNDKGVAGSPRVLRGLTSADAKTQTWQDHDVKLKGVRIRTVHTFHDEKEGSERGKNAVFVFEPEEKDAFATIVHLGDLGHALTEDQVKQIGTVDAVLVPVGGKFTIDAKAAKKVCEQLHPSHFLVPMHYKTKAVDLPLATAEEFLALFDDRVRREDGNEAAITPLGRGSWPKERGKAPYALVLGYEPKAKADKGEKGENGSKKRGAPDEVKDAGAAAVTVKGHKAWIDKLPGPDAKAGLHAEIEVLVTGGEHGATLAVSASVEGEKGAVTLEDDRTGETDAFEVKPGTRRTIKLVARDGQTSKAGMLDVKLELRSKAPGAKPAVFPQRLQIQEVE